MANKRTDLEWERIGARDPYYGALSDERFHKEGLSEETLDAFFQTGYDYVADIIHKIREYIAPGFVPRRTLDFGCGVGRLIIPLAEISDEVLGIDVSPSMLAEAKKNCESRSLGNVRFRKNDGTLSVLADEKFDFIHSFIVFQHIPVRKGERLVKALLAHLRKGGVCILHFTYSTKTDVFSKTLNDLKNAVPLVASAINLARGRHFSEPTIQMYPYNMNRILLLIQEIHTQSFFAEFTDHQGVFGLKIFFSSPA